MDASTLQLAQNVLSGHRVSLAKAITLVESTHSSHKLQAELLLRFLLKQKNLQKQQQPQIASIYEQITRREHAVVKHPATEQKESDSTSSYVSDHNASHLAMVGNDASESFRIGISGPPGVGKSTFIEKFGKLLTSLGHNVAVLAVDPSSVRTGGSILGDKTRMIELSRDPNAYIRASPTRGTLGGVTRTTGDAITVCEAAKYNVIIVETVGVGQSETAVEDMVDMFVLLAFPGGGDELQGIKKGIIELVDLIVINKADGDMQTRAKIACGEHTSALRLLRPKNESWTPQVTMCSAINNEQIVEVWSICKQFLRAVEENGRLHERRAAQYASWMWKMVNEEVIHRMINYPTVKKILPEVEQQVSSGLITPGSAADRLIQACFR